MAADQHGSRTEQLISSARIAAGRNLCATCCRFLENRVEVFEAQIERWDARVALLVRVLLTGGNCSIEHVAEHLGCDRRTVHRRLADCSTTFSEVLDDERAEIVLRLIEERSRPLAEIAEMIGFSAQSALARWFRSRFGSSISEWRSDPRERCGSPPAAGECRLSSGAH